MGSAINNMKTEQTERLERLRQMQLGRQDRIDSPRNIIQKAVQTEYPDVDRTTAERVTREMVLAPRHSTIKIGSDEIKVADLQFQIAESLELIGSETSSSQEYFSWFTESSEIMQHMNDGFISEDDLKERNEWIDMSYTREAEIMTCLALYQGSAFPEAKKKYADIYNKLVKLRQIRNAIKDSTGNKVDNPKEVDPKKKESDYKKAVVYVAAMREFIKRSPRWNMSKRTLEKLNMYCGDDADLADDYDDLYGMFDRDDLHLNDEQDMILYQNEQMDIMELRYSFDDFLKEEILFHWDDDRMQSFERSEAEDFIEMAMPVFEEKTPESEEDVREHIARLSGRRPPMKARPLSYNMDRARAFDSSVYRSLSMRTQNA